MISPEVSIKLLNVLQAAMSHLEEGKPPDVKCDLLRLAAIIRFKTDHESAASHPAPS